VKVLCQHLRYYDVQDHNPTNNDIGWEVDDNILLI
jgi:hypothetical protein